MRHSTSPVPRIMVTCANPECNNVYYVRQKQIERGISLFCSKACSNTARKYNNPEIERFYSHVDKTNTCWMWMGSVSETGYGLFNLSGKAGKTVRAHRYSYESINGKINDSTLHVCHKCDNPLCVNPDHLFLGTAKDNNEDKVKKGRQAKGEAIGCAKLTQKSIGEIFRLYENGHTITYIASSYGVDRSTIRKVVTRKTWNK